MSDINELFFEGQCKREQSQACLNSAECSLSSIFYQLIRVAIGTQGSLTRLPSEAEWEELFELAVKQSLVGICFIGLHTLGADSDDGFAKVGMSEDLFFDWMGMAAQINMKNELVNEQCVELQKRLAAEGYRSSILKGQGVATLYGEELRVFRQSGDIDMLVDCDYKRAAQFVSSITGKDVKWAYKDIRLEIFEDTEVELHIKPGLMFNPIHNHRWQKWYYNNKAMVFDDSEDEMFVTPAIEFNMVYILQHCYMHLFESGVGLRQIMDYYFVLQAGSIVLSSKIQELSRAIELLGMKKFASGMMWIMTEVFGLNENYLLCDPDEKEGRYLLNEVMAGGNFGKHDDRFDNSSSSRKDKLRNFIKRNLLLVGHYPHEALWTPFYFVWHFIVKLIKR